MTKRKVKLRRMNRAVNFVANNGEGSGTREHLRPFGR